MSFKRLSVSELKQRLVDAPVALVDIRDDAAFAAGHIEGSVPLNNSNAAEFVAQADKTVTLVVVCYHGHSSQDAAAFLATQGFSDVYSLDGGYTAWAVGS